ncbi:alkaline shock response membrane anchor protein AmaP [Rhodococcus sp. SGAir0479]|uniref:alkaline shock response membrane anchor protein AmaP n=1 Tax=Rhodococcus sp. SGAir0479 TaxID=2567884 RepID=UPI0010CD2CC0|nr:alkaline shock response membrane anchor protein AmaP [Rhodococcus sp. SGAir0479]QCQ93602.1 alkaline shock response membrane anchor protein AmaP [Rhodococcus sp. SGAir0479]
MTRVTSAVDRAAAAVVGLVLIALGAGALVWSTDAVARFPDTITAPAVVEATTKQWWPWAVGAAGVVFIIAAVRWIYAHTPAPHAHPIQLPGLGTTGSATVDLGDVATAAATSLTHRHDITDAKGKAIDERGRRTVVMEVTTSADADLAIVVDAVDTACRDVVHTLGTDEFAIRTLIRHGSRPRGRALR